MKKFFFVVLTTLLSVPVSAVANKKIPVCIDLTCFMETNAASAASCIGYLDAISYLTKTGHIPGIENLFEALLDAPAHTNIITYNQNYQMPLILSDWLLGESNEKIKAACFACLHNNSELAPIEKKVLKSIVDMMLTPKKLIETQNIISSTRRLIEDLHATGRYDIYLVGNWDFDSTQALLQKLTDIKMMHIFKDIIFSHDLKVLKPHPDFYNKMLAKIGCQNPSDCICMEREPVMQLAAQQLGFKYIPFSTKIGALRNHALLVGVAF